MKRLPRQEVTLSIGFQVWTLKGDNKPFPDKRLVGQKFVMRVSCEGVSVEALIDSEAMVSLITLRTLENIAGRTGGRILDRVR